MEAASIYSGIGMAFLCSLGAYGSGQNGILCYKSYNIWAFQCVLLVRISSHFTTWMGHPDGVARRDGNFFFFPISLSLSKFEFVLIANTFYKGEFYFSFGGSEAGI